MINLAAFIWLWRRLRATRLSQTKTIENLKRILNTNLIGIALRDANGNLIEANDYFLDLLKDNEDILRDLHSGSHTTPIEKEYLRSDGSRIWLLFRTTLVEGIATSYVLDVSARKRALQDLEEVKGRLEDNVAQRTKELLKSNRELYRLVAESEPVTERLRVSQAFLDSMIENIPNMIFVKDAKELRFVRINRAGEELLGLPQADFIGKNDYDFFPREQADFFTQKDRAVLTDRKVLDISEEPISTPRGTRYLHTTKIPLLDKFGRATHLLGISEDITEKKLAESQRLELMQAQMAREEAERTAQRLRFLSDASAALNVSLDVQSLLKSFAKVIVDNMANWCIIDFYYEKEKEVERMVATAKSGDIPEEVRNWWEKKRVDLDAPEGLGAVLRTGEARIYRNLSPESAKKYFPNQELIDKLTEWGIHSSMVVPLSYHGKVFGTICFISTSEKEYDDFDLSMAQDLTRRASLAIENARLYARANEASSAKSAFLANISHEIRTPLGAMLGFAELTLEEKNLTPAQTDYVSTIARNGRQLLRIVDEVLDLSKVESDRILIERSAFSLPSLFDEVQELLNIKANEKGLAMSFEGISELPSVVQTDPLRVRQILINIIGNAIKFTERGSVRVSARFAPHALNSKAGSLEVLVKDTGVGMTEEQAARLFQAFMQADGSMTRKFGGTGLGLFLSRKLARLLGGDVTLRKSSQAHGCEFSVMVEVETSSLPKEQYAVPPKSPSAPASEVVTESTREARVLVVEDSVDNRTLIGAMLKRSGVQLEMAENGVIGVKKALSNPYDLVLMDIQMPEMDGFEAIGALTREGYRGPVIALTAHAMKGDKERCIKAGFTDYICKPVTRQVLLNCLDRYVTGH